MNDEALESLRCELNDLRKAVTALSVPRRERIAAQLLAAAIASPGDFAGDTLDEKRKVAVSRALAMADAFIAALDSEKP